jgi:hypothetical protein
MTRFTISVTVTYEIEDEAALRDAAHDLPGRFGGENYNAGDAALRILAKEAATRLELPGCRAVASGPSLIAEDEA